MVIKKIFEQPHQNTDTCSFLYKISELPIRYCLINYRSVLHFALTFGLDVNMPGVPLYGQLIHIQSFLKKSRSPLLLNMLN
jgi:hypothetical protein